ncbi:hypothetical protein VNO77_03818 [Canavalia gladiata]|uniref:Uncharacterized protein n=1 Tax=Canavalia gladiata TaxID=3824 RepID=A0AAN9MW08_CANGL
MLFLSRLWLISFGGPFDSCKEKETQLHLEELASFRVEKNLGSSLYSLHLSSWKVAHTEPPLPNLFFTSKGVALPNRCFIQPHIGFHEYALALQFYMMTGGYLEIEKCTTMKSGCLVYEHVRANHMTKMFDILEAFTNLHGYTYICSDGSTQPASHARFTIANPLLLQCAWLLE